MKERLAELLEKEALTRNAFASKIGVQRSNVTHILEGRNKPGFDFIEKLLTAFPHVNAEWLICGRASMYKQATMASLFPNQEKVTKKEMLKDSVKDNDKRKVESEEIISSLMDSERHIERIIILYSDKTFDVYYK